MRIPFYFLAVLLLASCSDQEQIVYYDFEPVNTPSIVILGTAQDAGSPHINCAKDCCSGLRRDTSARRYVASIALVDPTTQQRFVFDATPDFDHQLHELSDQLPSREGHLPDGVFLTHAHIGHYTGLMYLGKEAVDARGVAVYAMPRMKVFLEQNGPWSQLVDRGNIVLSPLQEDSSVTVTPNFTVTPFLVPHRDEYSETVGYRIEGQHGTAIYIPDIDKWERWETSIVDLIAEVDVALIDATFYDAAEINNRDISQIPHPFVIETMELMKGLPEKERNKVVFIHLNHTNRLLDRTSDEYKAVIDAGFTVAERGLTIPL